MRTQQEKVTLNWLLEVRYFGRDRQPAERRTGDAAACVAIQELPTIGSYKDKVADVRIIAATNENLQEAVREGRFRSDLYYRLHEAVIEIPRLRDCKEDIMPLANFFLKLYDRHTDKEIKCISKEAQRALVSHTWPGNVRELKSCIMRAMLLCENEIIDVEDLQLSQSVLTEEALDFDEQERKINRERILWALKQCNGIKRDAAKCWK